MYICIYIYIYTYMCYAVLCSFSSKYQDKNFNLVYFIGYKLVAESVQPVIDNVKVILLMQSQKI